MFGEQEGFQGKRHTGTVRHRAQQLKKKEKQHLRPVTQSWSHWDSSLHIHRPRIILKWHEENFYFDSTLEQRDRKTSLDTSTQGSGHRNRSPMNMTEGGGGQKRSKFASRHLGMILEVRNLELRNLKVMSWKDLLWEMGGGGGGAWVWVECQFCVTNTFISLSSLLI